MNLQTRLTIEEIQRICERHGIIYKSHSRITTGFSHEVHRLNSDLIIKLFNKESNKNFLCESRILAIDDNRILKPSLVAAYEADNDKRSYIIMSYVPGKSLGSVWHQANDIEREALIKQISGVLRAFQDLNPKILDFQAHTIWQEHLNNKSKELVMKLLKKDIITPQRAEEVIQITNKMLNYFQANEPMVPLYWDIHFDNFIVNEAFQLQSIIDLENVRCLPADYPLFVVKKQMADPKKYLAEEDEKYANKADYKRLWGWYEKYYPEMFQFENLEMRLKLYKLLDELHLMIDWSHDAQLRASFTQLLEEISSI